MSLFYETQSFSLEKKAEVLHAAKDLSFRWWVDVLKGMRREQVAMGWDEIMAKISPSVHYTIVLREIKDIHTDKHYAEFGFVTNDNYYLWVLVEDKNFEILIKQFDLKTRRGK